MCWRPGSGGPGRCPNALKSREKFPAGRELAGNPAENVRIGAKKATDSRVLRKNSLRAGAGNFLQPSREFAGNFSRQQGISDWTRAPGKGQAGEPGRPRPKLAPGHLSCQIRSRDRAHRRGPSLTPVPGVASRQASSKLVGGQARPGSNLPSVVFHERVRADTQNLYIFVHCQPFRFVAYFTASAAYGAER